MREQWRVVVVVVLVVSFVIPSTNGLQIQEWWETTNGGLLSYSNGKERVLRAGQRWWDFYLPTKVSKSTECHSALTTMSEALSTSQLWPIRMMDSWGKSNDGYLHGNFFFVGFYDECLATHSPDGSIHGMPCRVILGQKPKNWTEDEGKTSWPRSPSVLVPIDPGPFIPYHLYMTCIPDSCSSTQLKDSLNEVLESTKFQVIFTSCDTEKEMSAGDISFIVVVSLLLLLVLAAAALDIYIENTGNTTLAQGRMKYLLLFSAYTNTRKLFQISVDKSPGTISCVHGIRVLSMTWVVLCHQYSMSLISNRMSVSKRINTFLFQAIMNGYPSVDTFFLLSGFLLAYTTLKHLSMGHKFNIFLFYVHRLIRLMPPIAVVAWLFATVAHLFVTGPFIPYWVLQQRGCEDLWWRDVLFINNFLTQPVRVLETNTCLAQTWYLAVDMQLYLVAPVIILPLFFYKKWGQAFLYLLTLGCIITPAAITYVYDLPPSAQTGGNFRDFNEKLSTMPWCRAGPWIVGIWLGYILYTHGDKKIKMQPWQVVTGWTLAATMGFFLVFGMWSYSTKPPEAEYDIITQVAYGGLSRPAWGAAVAWVIYACHYGYGGLVNSLLSHPSFQPLSRMTYTIYLVALSMQEVIVDGTRIPHYFSHINKIIETCGALVISGIVAYLVVLTVEAPIISLERILLRPDVKKQRPASPNPVFSESNRGQDNLSFTSEMQRKASHIRTNVGFEGVTAL